MTEPSAHPEDPAAQLLGAEYALLMAALTASWSVSILRATVFLGVLSATTVALGLLAQGGGFDYDFYVFAVVLLPVAVIDAVVAGGDRGRRRVVARRPARRRRRGGRALRSR